MAIAIETPVAALLQIVRAGQFTLSKFATPLNARMWRSQMFRVNKNHQKSTTVSGSLQKVNNKSLEVNKPGVIVIRGSTKLNNIQHSIPFMRAGERNTEG